MSSQGDTNGRGDPHGPPATEGGSVRRPRPGPARANDEPRFRSLLAIGPAPVAPSAEDVDAVADRAPAPSEEGACAKRPGNRGEQPSGVGPTKPRCEFRPRSVPPFYPLERTSRRVVGATADAIIARIAECCRVMSLQAVFNREEAVASLRSAERVEIRLSLWRGPPERHRAPDSIIVEARRWTGDAVAFHGHCRNVLDAAEGLFRADRYLEREEGERSRLRTAERMLAEGSAPLGLAERRRYALRALETAAGLLAEGREDARELGLESLRLLTDAARTGAGSALPASLAVVAGRSGPDDTTYGRDGAPGAPDIRGALLRLIRRGELAGEAGDTIGAGDAGDELAERDRGDPSPGLGLAVLANALDTLEVHGGTPTAGGRGGASPAARAADGFLRAAGGGSSGPRGFLAFLLGVVEGAEAEPHDACQAVRCVRSLCEASADARRGVSDLDGGRILSTALDTGRRTNRLLERETERALAALEKAK